MFKHTDEPRTAAQAQRPDPRRWTVAARVPLAVLMLVATTACHDEVKTEELRTCRPADGRSVSSNDEIQRLAGCQQLEGSVIVRHEVSDLSPLSSLKVIDGKISGGGFRSEPFDLDALYNLEVVGELYFLYDNITSFKGLSKLHTVAGWLHVGGVQELEDLRGLEKVRSLSRLDIEGNSKLRTLAGLDGLEEVKGDVRIKGNVLLPPEEVDTLLARIKVGGTIQRD